MNKMSSNLYYQRGVQMLMEMGIARGAPPRLKDAIAVIYPTSMMEWFDGRFHLSHPYKGDGGWIVLIENLGMVPEIQDPYEFARDYVCTYLEQRRNRSLEALNVARAEHAASIAFQRETTDILRMIETERVSAREGVSHG